MQQLSQSREKNAQRADHLYHNQKPITKLCGYGIAMLVPLIHEDVL